MVPRVQDKLNNLERLSLKLTRLVGTPLSVIVHTFLFFGIFALKYIGFSIESILLILTTAVSLEAIYLSIFIQMTVNRSVESLESVRDEVEDIQEDVEGLESDIEEISEDIDVIQDDDDENTKAEKSLGQIENQLQTVIRELDALKKRHVV